MTTHGIATSADAPRSQRGESPRKARWPEIDWLKGLAILFVLLIHARPIEGGPYEYLINRAVPMFIVLFGVTSELWWRGAVARGEAPIGSWYRTRLLRLMIPVWGMLLVWWPFAFTFDTRVPQGLSPVLATALGYMPWIGTGWFVTLIVQLVVVYPLLRAVVERIGVPVALVVSLAGLILSHLYSLEILGWVHALVVGGPPPVGFFAFYYFWIFAPQHFFLVVCGIALARTPLRGPVHAMAAAAVLAVGVLVLHNGWVHGVFAAAAFHAFLDVPLTIVMLTLISVVRLNGPIAQGLAWCGITSWGIYLGQMLVHSILHMFGPHPEVGPLPMRWAYFVCLLVGAVGFVTIGNGVRAALERNPHPRA